RLGALGPGQPVSDTVVVRRRRARRAHRVSLRPVRRQQLSAAGWPRQQGIGPVTDRRVAGCRGTCHSLLRARDLAGIVNRRDAGGGDLRISWPGGEDRPLEPVMEDRGEQDDRNEVRQERPKVVLLAQGGGAREQKPQRENG